MTACPKCHNQLPKSIHRRVNGFWSGITPQPCADCGVFLKYETKLSKKLMITGTIFRISLLAFIAVVVVGLRLGFDLQLVKLLLGASVIGVFGSATKPENIRVQIDEN